MHDLAQTRDAQSAPPLLEERRDGVVILRLNRPQARNSLSLDLLQRLHEALTRLGEDAATRVIVIAAAPPVFSAGHDLRELTARRADADAGRAFFDEVIGRCSAVMLAVTHCPKPVIACVNGVATAAGCQLVAACDLAVAAEDARFATPGVNIGLFCTTPAVSIARAVPRKAAMEMLLTGDMIDARQALAFGLINRIAAPEALLRETLALAERIAAKSPQAIAFGKRAFNQQIDLPLEEAYRRASAAMVDNMLAADACEGIGAFIDKRAPDWPSSR